METILNNVQMKIRYSFDNINFNNKILKLFLFYNNNVCFPKKHFP